MKRFHRDGRVRVTLSGGFTSLGTVLKVTKRGHRRIHYQVRTDKSLGTCGCGACDFGNEVEVTSAELAPLEASDLN